MPIEDDLKAALAEAAPEAMEWAKKLLADAAVYGADYLDGRPDQTDGAGEPLSLDAAVAAANRLEAKLAGEVKLREDGEKIAKAALSKGLRLALTLALAAMG